MDLRTNRKVIDEIDARIVELFKDRFKVAKVIGGEKKRLGRPVEDKDRDFLVLKHYLECSGDDLPAGFIDELVSLILRYSKEVQQ